jgi:ketosteroid isomerase-like protein
MGGNVDALRSVFHEDATVVYPTRGTITGRTAILEFYRQFLTVFPRVRAVVHAVAVENLFDWVGTNVLALCFEVHTTNRQGVTFTQEGMMLIRLRRGKIMLLCYYFADTVALADAWRASE